ncbi:MAG: tetratricopeptide repeat protein, partial [Lachnospira sp.]|nr:tetratricopeptide repeat protein [Lachnospira sp.]
MRCFKCGSLLTENDTCPKCGEDVRVYKKTAKASDAYYNAGLYKARVRDLTGAVESLKLSLMINKYNTNARNLLGLVYCEMGDVVEALSQWVVSKNFSPDDNIAGTYIKKIQTNQNRFEMITGTIKKYNLSLKYAKEGNYDMALIQLKKVVANNPQLIKAQLLLALLYIKQDELARAKKTLNCVIAIDRNNTLARMYLKEIDERTALKKADVSGTFLPKRKEKIPDKKPLSGNDVILPKSSYKEPSNGAITIINVLVGVVIGAALIWFLIVPARNKGITQDYKKSLQEYSEQLSSSNVEL